ncbi:MAG: hypothetical protein ACHQ5A_08515 [Opitutales bacterium]
MSAPLTLLASLIDYAGLFPPTSLAMEEAVREHAANLHGPQAALLSRFILPVGRLAEFEAEYRKLPAAAQAGWQLSVLAGGAPAADLAALQDFNRRQPRARIVALETKAVTPADVAGAVAPFPRELEVWVEIPLQGDTTPFLRAIKSAGCGAKIRTGGAATELFPSAPDVAHFLAACLAAGVAFKATAGLHHPLHSHYQLTGAPGSPQVSMLGFLNLFLAAVYLHSGGSPIYALALLGDTEPAAFSATPDALLWRGHAFPTAQLAAARRDFCRLFGSCSFTEPVDGLRALGWL